MAEDSKKVGASSAAGLSAGTGFSGLVLLFPDGLFKSFLLILSPAITIAISSSWHVVTEEVGARVADWRIRSQRKKAGKMLHALMADPSTSPDLLSRAKQNLEALTLVEVEITKRRVDAIAS
ncbi:hypothetical protein [Mesorhizobium sp. M0586]|uniref:hypothetical protein n=1 Tax=unclassified Mesorhizobium TaxID=325217 RepID=UPI0033363D17